MSDPSLVLFSDVEDSLEWIFYRLAAFGRTFHFNLTHNRWLVAPSFRVDIWNRDGGQGLRSDPTAEFSRPDEFESVSADCFYVGYLAKQEVTSRVAISNCNGLVGDNSILYNDYNASSKLHKGYMIYRPQ